MAALVDKTMLIDDSEIDLFIHRRFLELCNFTREILPFKSAETAIEALQSLNGASPPDIIFLDLNMPVVDGFSFLNVFDTLPDTVRDRTRIVVLTSSNSATDRDQVLSYNNVVLMITKPIRQADIERLRQLLG